MLTGCSRDSDLSPNEQAIAKSFDLYPAYAKEIKNYRTAKLYEGLPHQLLDKDLYEQELKNKKTVQIGEYSFYEEPLQINAPDLDALIALYCSPSSFRPYQGVAACGGFHPDFALQIVAEAKSFTIFFCFGCGEMKTVQGGQELYCEMTKDGKAGSKTLLKKYHRERPPGAASYWIR